MDALELAKKMIEWQEKMVAIQALEEEIKTAVLDMGKTTVVGGVRATYYNPKKTYDYQGAAENHPMVSDATIRLFTVTKTSVDWKSVCEHAGIDDIEYTESPARVGLKLEG